MPRSILVGLDGSTHCAAAVEIGIRWAQRSNAMLVGLGIIDEPTICKPAAVPLGAMSFKAQRDQDLLADATRRVDGYLEQFALRCANAEISHKLLEDVGLPAEQIMLEAQRYDVILLGRETHFHFETQEAADETLASVVRHSPRPVVAVPENPAEGTSVVVAYDGGLQAARALQAFQGIGWNGSQEVHIVCVHPDRVEAARRSNRAVEFLDFHEIKAYPHPVSTAVPADEAILEQARKVDAGLLVMGAYGRLPLKEFFFGSVTRAMLQTSSVPLFLYH